MFNRILVQIDGSDPANHAAGYAANLAAMDDTELIVMSVLRNVPFYFPEETEFAYYPELQEHARKSIEDLLKRTVDGLQRDHESLKMKTILKEGHPAFNIVETASEEEVDLIVVGNRGTGGILSWMLGSTSRSVAEACTVPVLVVKDRQFCEAS
jgi:nucleotide-binding universal stress UspA family protein